MKNNQKNDLVGKVGFDKQDPDSKELGLLSYEEIVEVVFSRNVKQFNNSSHPSVKFDGDIVVRRLGWPEYRFNEHGASAAVLNGDKLTMPDAQGFSCTFLLE